MQVAEISMDVQPVGGTVVVGPTVGRPKSGEPEIEISIFKDDVEIRWRELRAQHWSVAHFLDIAQAFEFARKLSARLLIDEWLEEIERVNARKGAA